MKKVAIPPPEEKPVAKSTSKNGKLWEETAKFDPIYWKLSTTAPEESAKPEQDAEMVEQDDIISVEMLVAKCSVSKCMLTHAVLQKGVDPDRCAVERLKREIQLLGCNHESVPL